MKTNIRIIPRKHYIDMIEPFIGTNLIKILTGQRRVGKSYILESIAQKIKKNDPNANIITINLEDFAFAHITNANSLFNEVNSKLSGDKKNYIFIDEIQEIDDFDKVVRSLNLNPLNDIYITGSNSKMLSTEMASRLAGRHIEFRIHPLSYLEYLRFHKKQDSMENLEEYLRYGGLPYLINLPSKTAWSEYINSVTDAIVYRDVVARNDVRNNDFLQRLLCFLADNIGQMVTAKKIADFLKSQRLAISVNSVQNYLGYIEQACIVNSVRRWDIEGKRYFEIGEKFFFEDLGMRNQIVGLRPNDRGSLIENAVYNHLILNGYDVKIGIAKQNKEIDFIATKNEETRYIQVALRIDDEQTYKREFGNLLSIPDNFRKTVVTLSDSTPNTHEGVEMVSLGQFLLNT